MCVCPSAAVVSFQETSTIPSCSLSLLFLFDLSHSQPYDNLYTVHGVNTRTVYHPSLLSFLSTCFCMNDPVKHVTSGSMHSWLLNHNIFMVLPLYINSSCLPELIYIPCLYNFFSWVILSSLPPFVSVPCYSPSQFLGNTQDTRHADQQGR